MREKNDAAIGWSDKPKDAPEILSLIEHLEANNGIRDLSILSVTDVDEAVRMFKRDGFVVIADVLGVDRADLWTFKRWGDLMISGNIDVLSQKASTGL